MKEEQWIQKIKEQLDDYSEPLSPSGWERLEGEIAQRQASVTRRKIIGIFHRGIAVAAALLLGVFGINFWLLNSLDENEQNTNAIALAMLNPKQQYTSVATGGTMDAIAYSNGNRHPIVYRPYKTDFQPDIKPDGTPNNEEKTIKVVQTKDENSSATTAQAPQTATQKVKSRESYPKQKKTRLAEGIASKNKPRKGWSMGISVANVGSIGNSLDNNATNAIYQGMPAPGINYSSFDLLEASNGILTIPQDQELVFKNGMPYLQSKSKQIVSIHHKQPISFGFSIRKNLPKNFSVETGLTYTYLASEITYADETSSCDQRLHYIGIPLRANWNFVNRKAFIIYLSGGGAVEKCVYGKMGNETATVSALQLSVTGAVGAQYNISNRIGLYIEPGIAYFFDDGSSVQTVRKESPCNFSLQAGLRLNY